ncbi:MAG: MBL fold metallo-hydrolase [Phycisphaerales bacterium]
MPSRRTFLTTTAATFAGIAAASPLTALARAARPLGQNQYFDWTDLGRGLHVASGGAVGGGGNALLIVGDGEAALIDAKLCGLGPTLRREAESRLGDDARLTHLISTHHHGDHIGGNPSFGDVTRVGHSNLNPRVMPQIDRLRDTAASIARRVAGADAGVPVAMRNDIDAMLEDAKSFIAADFEMTQTLRDELELEVGGVRLQLRHAGPGHTDNDVFIFLPDHNVLHTGDLFFNKLHPYMDIGAGATSRGWQQSLLNCIQRCDGETVVVPGHGEISNRDGLGEQVKYFDEMRRIIRFARDVESMTRDEVTKLQPGRFAEYGNERLLTMNLGAIYDELADEKKQ